MILPAVWERVLAELGRSEGGADTLALLVRDQDTRRLLLLRAVLDAAEGADTAICGGAEKSRLRDDWALLAEADRVAPVGPWAPGSLEDRAVPPGSRAPGNLTDRLADRAVPP
ncbi:HEXXH motif-containing protein, partial [Streptomyces sp. yr375]